MTRMHRDCSDASVFVPTMQAPATKMLPLSIIIKHHAEFVLTTHTRARNDITSFYVTAEDEVSYFRQLTLAAADSECKTVK